jgi:CHAD domain-containing protein
LRAVAAAEPTAVSAVTSLATAFARLCEKQIEILSTVGARALAADDPDAVHDLRVATRRLQEALAIFASTMASKRVERLRRNLRRVRRRLGAWRNFDVVLAEVRRRRSRTRSARARALWDLIRDSLERRRIDEMIRARKRLVHDDLRQLPDRATAVAAAIARDIDAERIDSALGERIREAWSEWQSAFETARSAPSVGALHTLRIATKRLRYRVESAHALGEPGCEPVLRWARQVQQRLGDWHDQQVLQQLVAEAIARPDVLLSQLDLARFALSLLERERRETLPTDARTVALASESEGRTAVEACLDRLKPQS